MSKYIYSYLEEISAHELEDYADTIPIHSAIVPVSIDIYQLDDYPEEEIEEPIGERIGFVNGYLVLGRELECMTPSDVHNRDAYMNLICDDIDADLGYVISALLEDDGPLSLERTAIGVDHLYIDEIHLSDTSLMTSVLDALPEMVFMHLHVYPEIMSYYPAPLPHEVKKTEEELAFEEKAGLLQAAIAEQILTGKKDPEMPELALTEEQFRVVAGMRQYGDTYPAKFIDKKAWQPYLDAGFEEWKHTRVLYRFSD